MKTANYLIEICLAELPTAAVANLSSAWQTSFAAALKAENLHFSGINAFATPRRLALQLTETQVKQADATIEKRGPALKAAKDNDGNWTKAALGFAKSCGVEPKDLVIEPTPKGDWLFYRGTQPGQSLDTLLPNMVKTTLLTLPIAKRMRWGTGDFQFVRPVLSYTLLKEDKLIEAQLLGVKSTKHTYGHRVHGDKMLEISNALDYEKTLEKNFVIADFEKRRQKIKSDSEKLAQRVQGQILWDQSILNDVNALTEYPVCLLGHFNPSYLALPQEVLIMTMQSHQKYFPVIDDKGALLPHFIVTANIDSTNPDVVTSGNQYVIEARFADAKFFWDNDRKAPLIQRLAQLKNVTYRDKLGTLSDRVERIEKIASHVAEQTQGDTDQVRRAAKLAKCDLVTDMVFEFGELQGIMGRYYAFLDGESDEIAEAMVEQYLPKFSGDRLPTTSIGFCLATAEKLETIIGGFAVGAKPSGTKDPYAIRRNTLGLIRLMNETSHSLPLAALFKTACSVFPAELNSEKHVNELLEYCNERLKGYTADKGIRHDVFDAVSAINPKTIKDFMARTKALQAFLTHEDANDLFSANKRASNILKKVELIEKEVNPNLQADAAEKALYDKLVEIDARVNNFVSDTAYAEALAELAELRVPLDRFFDEVMVMDDNLEIRTNRLALLDTFTTCTQKIADLSLITPAER